MQTFQPFGLRFVGSLGGDNGNVQRPYRLPNGASCPNLGRGSPLKITNGAVTSVGATGDAPLLGVATGFAWIDPTSRQEVRANSIPAGTSSAGFVEGENRPVVYVVDDADAMYYIQANASVSSGDLGRNFNVTAVGGDVDAVYGVSRYSLQASTRTSAVTGALKIVGLARMDGNAWDNPFPVVVVKINRSIMAEASAF